MRRQIKTPQERTKDVEQFIQNIISTISTLDYKSDDYSEDVKTINIYLQNIDEYLAEYKKTPSSELLSNINFVQNNIRTIIEALDEKIEKKKLDIKSVSTSAEAAAGNTGFGVPRSRSTAAAAVGDTGSVRSTRSGTTAKSSMTLVEQSRNAAFFNRSKGIAITNGQYLSTLAKIIDDKKMTLRSFIDGICSYFFYESDKYEAKLKLLNTKWKYKEFKENLVRTFKSKFKSTNVLDLDLDSISLDCEKEERRRTEYFVSKKPKEEEEEGEWGDDAASTTLTSTGTYTDKKKSLSKKIRQAIKEEKLKKNQKHIEIKNKLIIGGLELNDMISRSNSIFIALHHFQIMNYLSVSKIERDGKILKKFNLYPHDIYEDMITKELFEIFLLNIFSNFGFLIKSNENDAEALDEDDLPEYYILRALYSTTGGGTCPKKKGCVDPLCSYIHGCNYINAHEVINSLSFEYYESYVKSFGKLQIKLITSKAKTLPYISSKVETMFHFISLCNANLLYHHRDNFKHGRTAKQMTEHIAILRVPQNAIKIEILYLYKLYCDLQSFKTNKIVKLNKKNADYSEIITSFNNLIFQTLFNISFTITNEDITPALAMVDRATMPKFNTYIAAVDSGVTLNLSSIDIQKKNFFNKIFSRLGKKSDTKKKQNTKSYVKAVTGPPPMSSGIDDEVDLDDVADVDDTDAAAAKTDMELVETINAQIRETLNNLRIIYDDIMAKLESFKKVTLSDYQMTFVARWNNYALMSRNVYMAAITKYEAEDYAANLVNLNIDIQQLSGLLMNITTIQTQINKLNYEIMNPSTVSVSSGIHLVPANDKMWLGPIPTLGKEYNAGDGKSYYPLADVETELTEDERKARSPYDWGQLNLTDQAVSWCIRRNIAPGNIRIMRSLFAQEIGIMYELGILDDKYAYNEDAIDNRDDLATP